jgi:hypothetical protein
MSTGLGTFSVCLLTATLVILAGCAGEEDWQPNNYDYQVYLNSLKTFRGEILKTEVADYNDDKKLDLHIQVLKEDKHEQYILIVTFPEYELDKENYRHYLINPRWHKNQQIDRLTFFYDHLRPGTKIMIPTSYEFSHQVYNLDYRFIYLEGDSFNFPENI